eukprot:670038-Prymnesium_polylepis.1
MSARHTYPPLSRSTFSGFMSLRAATAAPRHATSSGGCRRRAQQARSRGVGREALGAAWGTRGLGHLYT